MIISRAECRLLTNFFSEKNVSTAWLLTTETEYAALKDLVARVSAEAAKPDEPASIVVPRVFTDATIRKGDRVSQSNKPGRRDKYTPDMFDRETRIYGTVMLISAYRARVLFEECDAIPVSDYAQWVPLSELRKEAAK